MLKRVNASMAATVKRLYRERRGKPERAYERRAAEQGGAIYRR